MKNLLLIGIASFICLFSTGDLFENIRFEKNRAVKKNIPVTFHAVGRTGNEVNVFKSFNEIIKSHSSLHFIYNNKEYYIPISNEIISDSILNLDEGDTLFVDIIIFDSIDSNAIDRTVKNYYSYISKIVYR